jgi:transposase
VYNRLDKTQENQSCPSRCVWLTQKERLEAAIKDVQNQLRVIVKTYPDLKNSSDLLQTIPGIGETTAWVLLAEIPTIENFQDARQLSAYAGVTPRHRQSGSSVHGRSRLSKLGSSRLRKAIYFPALVAQRYNPIMSVFANRLIENGKSKMTVLGACMRKLIHIVFGVLKHQKPFEPKIFA